MDVRIVSYKSNKAQQLSQVLESNKKKELLVLLGKDRQFYRVNGRHVHILRFYYSYAPWCPACKQFASTWESFANEMKDTDVRVGKVDVTADSSKWHVSFCGCH